MLTAVWFVFNIPLNIIACDVDSIINIGPILEPFCLQCLPDIYLTVTGPSVIFWKRGLSYTKIERVSN